MGTYKKTRFSANYSAVFITLIIKPRNFTKLQSVPGAGTLNSDASE